MALAINIIKCDLLVAKATGEKFFLSSIPGLKAEAIQAEEIYKEKYNMPIQYNYISIQHYLYFPISY